MKATTSCSLKQSIHGLISAELHLVSHAAPASTTPPPLRSCCCLLALAHHQLPASDSLAVSAYKQHMNKNIFSALQQLYQPCKMKQRLGQAYQAREVLLSLHPTASAESSLAKASNKQPIQANMGYRHFPGLSNHPQKPWSEAYKANVVLY